MSPEHEHNLAVIAILSVDIEARLRSTPDSYGSNHERDAETLRRIGERCRADFEAAVVERVMDEHTLEEILGAPADQFVLYPDGVDMSAYETGES